MCGSWTRGQGCAELEGGCIVLRVERGVYVPLLTIACPRAPLGMRSPASVHRPPSHSQTMNFGGSGGPTYDICCGHCTTGPREVGAALCRRPCPTLSSSALLKRHGIGGGGG